MKIIRNNYIFARLMAVSELDTKNDIDVRLWKCLFDSNGDILDDDIPILAGGLDRIVVTKNQIVFNDIGSSVGGVLKDNSFVIRRGYEKQN